VHEIGVFSGQLLLGILNPADELVSSRRRDVLPRIKRRLVGDQRIAQVCGKVVQQPLATLVGLACVGNARASQ
jgi:hypothetical protein